MQNDTLEQVGDDPAILAAIERAERQAGRSNKEFVRALIKDVNERGGARVSRCA